MKNVDLTAILKREGIRSITVMPDHCGGDIHIRLKCGGPAGIGLTVAEALVDAKAKNADWLDLAA